MITSFLYYLNEIFIQHGHDIRIVGGAVRDYIRGMTPKDIDLATTATPDEMINIFKENNIRYIETGLKHGTLTILHGPVEVMENSIWAQEPFYTSYEITTLRVDARTDGRHAEVEFVTDWQQDAARRDFTMNALSMSMDDEIHDYFDGIKHINENKVVFVGDPRKRIKEDYLRILRYYRFKNLLGDTHTNSIVSSIIMDEASGLQKISGERIWMEMSKILSTPSNSLGVILDDMTNNKVLEMIGIRSSYYGLIRLIRRRLNKYHHISFHNEPIMMLSCLIYNTAEAEILIDLWKLSNNDKNMLLFLVTHMNINDPEERRKSVTNIQYYKNIATNHYYGKNYALALSLILASDFTEELYNWVIPKFPIGGIDILNAGVPRSPMIGDILRQLEQKWKDSNFSLNADELRCMIPNLINNRSI